MYAKKMANATNKIKKRKADKDNNKAPAKQQKKESKKSKIEDCPACRLKVGEIPTRAPGSAFCSDCYDKWISSFCDDCNYFIVGNIDDTTGLCDTCSKNKASEECPDCGQLYTGDASSPEYEPHVCGAKSDKSDEDQPGSSKQVLDPADEDASYALIAAIDSLNEAVDFGSPAAPRVPNWKNVLLHSLRIAEIAKSRADAQGKS